jgi:hypothetical protein
MKLNQLRESTPLWVWLALALMGLGAVAYLSGYFMIDELLSTRQ